MEMIWKKLSSYRMNSRELELHVRTSSVNSYRMAIRGKQELRDLIHKTNIARWALTQARFGCSWKCWQRAECSTGRHMPFPTVAG